MRRLACPLLALCSAASVLKYALAVALSAVGGCTGSLDRPHPSAQPDWVLPGVKLDHGRVTRRTLVEDNRLRDPRDICAAGDGVAVTGSRGTLVLDAAWQPVSWQPLATGEGVGAGFHIVDLDGRGSHRLFREAMVGVDPGLFAMDGSPLWTLARPDQFFTDWASGDLEGDGTREFVLAFTTEIVAVNGDGSIRWIWKTPRRGSGVFAEVAVADAVPGGRPEVIAGVGGDLLILDAAGNTVSRSTPAVEGFFATFAVVRWPTARDPETMLVAEDDRLVALSLDGRERLATFAPRSGLDPRAAPVRLKAGEPPCLAVLAGVMYQGREDPGFEAFNTALSIYDATGELVYREVLDGSNAALLVLPGDEGAAERLVIATGFDLRLYSAVAER